jgi:hypothetical protein
MQVDSYHAYIYNCMQFGQILHACMNMDIRFSPYNAPFVPAGPPGVHWIPRELQFAPHDAHVAAFREYRQAATAGIDARLQARKRDKVMDLLADLSACGIKAARTRLVEVRRAEIVTVGGSIAGERGAADVGSY